MRAPRRVFLDYLEPIPRAGGEPGATEGDPPAIAQTLGVAILEVDRAVLEQADKLLSAALLGGGQAALQCVCLGVRIEGHARWRFIEYKFYYHRR